MHRQSYDLQLTRYDKCGWRDVLYAPQLPRFARQREQAEPKAPSRPSPS